MRYIIADKGKVLQHGIKSIGHRVKDGSIVIHEKELTTFIPGETEADKLRVINGKMYTADEIKITLKEEGWK